ncbi:hypothetical protein GLYMA_18G026900v4 [Glycine max]|uniref:Protein kinase domain-containing protein n=1 Tax=Glycine max TaxID=3847 RepID=K7MPJ2_SOYBN|nr:hypothetical protein GLYMA_18G026900v4 [Glycine max]
MDYEIAESTDKADITVDARSFSWAVDSAIKSETASILGESRIHSFCSVVDNAIRSRTASDLGTSPSPVHSLASAVANAMSSSSAAPFSQLETSPSPVQSLASAVPSAMSRSKAAPFSQLEVVPNATRHVPARLFTWAELKAATNNFSPHNRIRHFGTFGFGYRGKLVDGREVAIVKGTQFGKSEFAIFSRLDHRNLVGLVGYCENRDERLSVYEYMKNGLLRDCLHDKNNVDKDSSVLNSWKMRIKIAWDASLGIQYLHNYANPSIIHRDIKSSNILLDASWTARVFDFELSFICPEPDDEYDEIIMGTMGYMCPEYMTRGVLTAKCDVYGLGVVLLELLTGKRAILLESEEDGPPFYLVDFAVPPILAGDLVEILDSRVGPPDLKEAEALKILAHTAIRCVEEEPRQRPTMNDIVVDLDRAFAICGSSLYDENFSYSIALPSHESNHMTPDPLDTDSCDIPIYEENTNS